MKRRAAVSYLFEIRYKSIETLTSIGPLDLGCWNSSLGTSYLLEIRLIWRVDESLLHFWILVEIDRIERIARCELTIPIISSIFWNLTRIDLVRTLSSIGVLDLRLNFEILVKIDRIKTIFRLENVWRSSSRSPPRLLFAIWHKSTASDHPKVYTSLQTFWNLIRKSNSSLLSQRTFWNSMQI